MSSNSPVRRHAVPVASPTHRGNFSKIGNGPRVSSQKVAMYVVNVGKWSKICPVLRIVSTLHAMYRYRTE